MARAASLTPRMARPRSSATVADRLIESRLTPNAISLTGFVLCVVAALLVLDDRYLLGGLAFIVGSICDTLDGRYARMSGKGTPFGAFLDSSIDRFEEGFVLAAVAANFAGAGDDAAAGIVVIAAVASLMVSYTRARAEALGVECKVGIADRAVRVVILSAGLVLQAFVDALEPAIYVLAALAVITVGQRVWHVHGELPRGSTPVTASPQRGSSLETSDPQRNPIP